jgi:5-formyltetrahydrofolate cyclo-ligase
VPQSLKKRAVELERRIKERAEVVKRALREYRETQRASAATPKGTSRNRDRARLLKKRLDVERENAEYIQLQKELDLIRVRLQARK